MKKITVLRIQLINAFSIICFMMFSLSSNGQEKSTFKVSDGTPFNAKGYYPEFNWDTTPMYTILEI